MHLRCFQQAQLPHSRCGPQHPLFSAVAVDDSDFGFAAVKAAAAVVVAAAVVGFGGAVAVAASGGAFVASGVAAGFESGLYFAVAIVGVVMAVVSCSVAAALLPSLAESVIKIINRNGPINLKLKDSQLNNIIRYITY